jgi:DNA-directed RNA polymerase specialized sigma24 family protein
MIDPHDLEVRFSTEQGMAYLDSIFEETTPEAHVQIERVREIMESLPAREADFVDMYFFKKLKQTDIARIFGVSQPTVCYRLRRATTRIQFLMTLPHTTETELEAAMRGFLSDPMDIRIMVLMWETTCQSEVAKRLGVSQGLVRHRFIRTVRKMAQNENLKPYADMFSLISLNLNILREVRRPAWDERVTHVVD